MPQVQSSVIEGVLKEIEHLPTLPQVVTKVMAMTDSDRVNAIELSRAMDQSLSAKVLKVANSAYYGSRFSRKVNSVHHAVVIIGFEAVKEIILTTSFFHTFRDKQDVDSLQPLWKHSLECAFAAKRLAWAFRYEGMDEAYLVGLIHDIGKLIVHQHFPDQFKAIAAANGSRDPLEVELEVLGISHARIGGKMSRHWDFPDPLVEAIDNHHGGNFPTNPKLGRILFLANRYVSGLIDFQGLIREFQQAGMNHPASWQAEDLKRVEEMLRREMEQGNSMLQSSKDS